MGSGSLPPYAFEPVLIEKRGEGGLPEFDLPEDAKERRHGFFPFALKAEKPGGALGRRAIAGLGAGAEAKIDLVSALGSDELKVGRFVQEHIGFGLTARRLPIP